MAILHDQIGSQLFIRLDGTFILPRWVHADITRPGADGAAFHRISRNPEPFRLTGFVDSPTIATAEQLADIYRSMVSEVVAVRLRGIIRSPFVILDAKVVEIMPFANAVGGLWPGLAGVQSEWELVYAKAS